MSLLIHITVDSLGKQIGRRIRELRQRAGATQSAWADRLGMSFQQISNYENGRIPDPPFLLKIAEISQVSVDWLLTGKETARGAPSIRLPRNFPDVGTAPDLARHLAVPVLTREAATGRLRRFTSADIGTWAWLEISLLRGRHRHGIVAVQMMGDSMEPIIRRGSIVAVDVDDRKVVKKGIYALTTPSGEWTIKHVKQTDSGLVLLPANPGTNEQYPSQIDLKRHPDTILGRLVYVWQRLA